MQYTSYICIQDTLSSRTRLAFRPSASREQRYLAYKSYICSLAHSVYIAATRSLGHARATIGYFVSVPLLAIYSAKGLPNDFY